MKRNAIRLAGLAAACLISGAAAAQSSSVVLRDDFDGQQFAADGGLYYRDNLEQRAGTFEFQKQVKLQGAGALKLSVKPMCEAADEGCSERAEIWEKSELRVPYDQGVWYGFAVKFGDPILIDDHRYVFAQWKREIEPGAEGDFSPFLALRMRYGKLFATVETNYVMPLVNIAQNGVSGCGAGGVPVWFRPETNQMRALVATDAAWQPDDNDRFEGCTTAIKVVDHGNKLPRSMTGWIEFAVYTKPGPDGTGHIEIFANGKPIVTVTGHIGHADRGLGKNQYFKFGPYRAGHINDWTLYYDNFKRSPRCADVLGEGQCPFP